MDNCFTPTSYANNYWISGAKQQIQFSVSTCNAVIIKQIYRKSRKIKLCWFTLCNNLGWLTKENFSAHVICVSTEEHTHATWTLSRHENTARVGSTITKHRSFHMIEYMYYLKNLKTKSASMSETM